MARGTPRENSRMVQLNEYDTYSQENSVYDFDVTLSAFLGPLLIANRRAGRGFPLTNVGGRVVHKVFG